MVNAYLIIGIIAIVALFLVFLTIGKFQSPKYTSVRVGNATVNAELADTPAKQVRGLMFRESLPKNDGMLFTFQSEGRHGIWMMNTTIPLDVIWLDKEKRIVHIEKNIQPCGALLICPIFKPDSNAKYVLEVNSGYTSRNGIKVGSIASFNL